MYMHNYIIKYIIDIFDIIKKRQMAKYKNVIKSTKYDL